MKNCSNQDLPFSSNANKLKELQVSIIPCYGKESKVAWKKYQNHLASQMQIENWINQFPDANIGIITGHLSNITVIDCDDPTISIEDLQNEFGETSFIVSTPRGGKHLYYSHNNESSQIKYQGRQIDIKGEGGYVISPKSLCKKKRISYSITKGSLDDLPKLPALKIKLTSKETKFLQSNKCGNSDLLIPEGERNNYLFNKLKETAKSCKTFEKLIEKAFVINSSHLTLSLHNNEVEQCAKSVWKYKMTNSLYLKSDNYISSSKDEMNKLKKYPRALFLLLHLRLNHEGIRKKFAIDQIKVSRSLSWNRKTLKKNIDILISEKLIFKHDSANKKTSKQSKIKTEAYQYSFYK